MLIDVAPRRWSRALLLVFLATTLWSGCSPDDFLVADEDRDRNFQRARDAERLGDYDVASEYYERAIERNPRAPSVHLGYASLCESQLRRYADAVYHYQRYLRLRPDDPKAEDIRRRITNCTERLATSVPLVIRSETIARDLESVRTENLSLRGQVTNHHAASVYWSNEWRRASIALAQLQAQTPSPGAGPSTGSRAVVPAVPRPSTTNAPPASVEGGAAAGVRGADPASATARSHRIESGETLERIAKRYGITLRALQQANPRVDARRLRPGTELKIPAR